MSEIDAQQFAGIAIAALGGAAIGVERERSGHASGPHAHFGGIRTFTLLGLLAGVAGWMAMNGLAALGTVLLAAAGAVIVTGYVASSRVDTDATTEVAGVVTMAAGALAGAGQMWLGGGLTAITAVLLMEKTRLHTMVGRIDDAGLRAGFRFAVMAIVILPLLPAGPYGPFGGVKPRQLWMLVLFFAGLNFAGYVARRLAGPDQGYLWTGVIGGLISSTNVTWTFARLSRTETAYGGPLALGVLGACAVMYVRMILATLVLNHEVSLALMPLLAAPFVVGCGALVFGLWRRQAVAAAVEQPENPLNLKSALQVSALFQVVMFAIYFAQQYGGQRGVLVSGAVIGLTDVDALLVSMSRAARETVDVGTAAMAIAIGALSNTLLKLALAASLGVAQFRWLASVGLVAMAAASVVAIAWGYRG